MKKILLAIGIGPLQQKLRLEWKVHLRAKVQRVIFDSVSMSTPPFLFDCGQVYWRIYTKKEAAAAASF
ncbi:hypothetical protein [Metabacillus sp. 84]|uniref:hypothetical protein n=1 Tax=Metabacillus sp. 84 TaxID=3404705 RepID=UPI003CFB33A4